MSMLDRRLLRLHAGALTVVADLSALAPAQCNDMVVDSQGRAYVGNFGAEHAAGMGRFEPTVLVLVAFLWALPRRHRIAAALEA